MHGDALAEPKDMSIEVSVLAPIASIYYGLFGYKLWDGGQLLVGPSFIGLDEESGSGSHEAYTAVIGASQRIWRGLQVRNLSFVSYDRFHSDVDGQLYKGLMLWNEVRLGYVFDFSIKGESLYLNVDTMLALGVTTNEWPKANEDMDLTWIPIDANLGWRF